MGFPMVSYTRFVQYHQENVAKGNLWKYGENNERTVAHESIWTFRLKLLTNILCVLYKIFRNFISTITRHDTTMIILTKSVTNLITWVIYCKDILSKKISIKSIKNTVWNLEKFRVRHVMYSYKLSILLWVTLWPAMLLRKILNHASIIYRLRVETWTKNQEKYLC